MKNTQKEILQNLLESGQPSIDDFVETFKDIVPLLDEFKNTEQDPGWHAEGNVHIHTGMVLDEMYKIFNTKEFVPTPKQRRILILACLFHDIAKPITTHTRDDGRIGARGHEEKGMHYLVYRLLCLDLPHDEYIAILKLVGLHQHPKMLVIQEARDSKYLQLNNEVSYELLYWLEVADMRGRIGEDIDVQLMYLEEFYNKSKQLLEQDNLRYHLSDIPSNFTLDVRDYCNVMGEYSILSGNTTSLEEAYSKFYEHARKHSKVVLMCAVSGTGKSTYVKSLDLVDPLIISMDDIREEVCKDRQDQSKNEEVYLIARERFLQGLRDKRNIVWDATNTRKEYRKKLLGLCVNYKARAELHVLLAKPETIKVRNKNRKYAVPEEIVDKQISKFQLPFLKEAPIVKYIITE